MGITTTLANKNKKYFVSEQNKNHTKEIKIESDFHISVGRYTTETKPIAITIPSDITVVSNRNNNTESHDDNNKNKEKLTNHLQVLIRCGLLPKELQNTLIVGDVGGIIGTSLFEHCNYVILSFLNNK